MEKNSSVGGLITNGSKILNSDYFFVETLFSANICLVDVHLNFILPSYKKVPFFNAFYN